MGPPAGYPPPGPVIHYAAPPPMTMPAPGPVTYGAPQPTYALPPVTYTAPPVYTAAAPASVTYEAPPPPIMMQHPPQATPGVELHAGASRHAHGAWSSCDLRPAASADCCGASTAGPELPAPACRGAVRARPSAHDLRRAPNHRATGVHICRPPHGASGAYHRRGSSPDLRVANRHLRGRTHAGAHHVRRASGELRAGTSSDIRARPGAGGVRGGAAVRGPHQQPGRLHPASGDDRAG